MLEPKRMSTILPGIYYIIRSCTILPAPHCIYAQNEGRETGYYKNNAHRHSIYLITQLLDEWLDGWIDTFLDRSLVWSIFISIFDWIDPWLDQSSVGFILDHWINHWLNQDLSLFVNNSINNNIGPFLAKNPDNFIAIGWIL